MDKLKFDSEKPYMFVSYSSINVEIIKNNVEYLQKKYNINIWYDEDLTAGAEWDKEALPRLRDTNCKIVLFFASEEALMSKNVRKELDAANRFHKIIIPINFSEKSFDDVLNYEILRKYNRTDPEGVTNADHLIQEHLNENKTYIYLHKTNYYPELIKAIIRHSNNTIEIIETDYNPKEKKKEIEKEIKENKKRQEVKITPTTTLKEFRSIVESNEEFCNKLREIRTGEDFKGKRAYFDYAMASVLKGCNSIKLPYQIAYYNYTVSNQDNKKEDTKTQATWTWSSNARKTIGQNGSGQLDPECNDVFTNLPDGTTLGEVMHAFEQGKKKAYQTKDNSTIIKVFQSLILL